MKEFKLPRNKGWFAGVCAGLAYALQIPVLLLRIIWFIAIWYYGVGLGLYIIIWIIAPIWNRDPTDMEN